MVEVLQIGQQLLAVAGMLALLWGLHRLLEYRRMAREAREDRPRRGQAGRQGALPPGES